MPGTFKICAEQVENIGIILNDECVCDRFDVSYLPCSRVSTTKLAEV